MTQELIFSFTVLFIVCKVKWGARIYHDIGLHSTKKLFLIRAYIDTPVDEIMTKHYDQDFWGLANILRAADRRIGLRRLETLRKRKGSIAAQKVIFARQSLQNECNDTVT